VANKNPKNVERRALVEKMRQEQARKERRRSMAILGVCIVAVIGLLAAALIPYLKDRADEKRLQGLPIDKIGVSTAKAACDPIKTADASGNAEHIPSGTPIDYPDAPPAFGKHWGNFLVGSEIRPFYTVDDRPELERMVHSLEHGHTIAWYDDTVKPGTKAYDDLKAIAEKLPASSYFMAAPWKPEDGKAFPEGKHVVLTHWTGPDNQKGIWEYCGAPSGAVVKKFLQDYPAKDAPEPGAA
jgi:hypothetical protein